MPEQETTKQKETMNFIEDVRKNVFTRVGVSEIHGVGVIAIRDIPKGINPMRTPKPEKFGVVKARAMQAALISLPYEIQKLIVAMCPMRPDDDEWDVPANGLNSINVAWYLNHSDKPNMRERGGDFFTKRKIKKGEELTVDYGTYGALNL